jgi:hypothetical protein
VIVRTIRYSAGSGPKGGIMAGNYLRRLACVLAALGGLATSTASADCCFFTGNGIGAGQAGLGYTGPTGATGNRTIDVIAGLAGTQKASLVLAALITDPIFNGQVMQIGNRVEFAGAPIFDVTDSTGETNTLAEVGKVFPNGSLDFAKSVQLGFTGTSLTGVDATGAPSTFLGQIKFGSVNDVVNLNMFNMLRAGLPVALQSNLSLNLATGRITFIEPANVFDALVCVQGTDRGVTTGLNLTVSPVPEPSALISASTGLAIVVSGSWYRRRRA